jgi:ketosteroid isomerase-like protein
MISLQSSEIEARIRRMLDILSNVDDRGYRDLDAFCAMVRDEVVHELPFHAEPIILKGKSAMRAFFEKTQGVFARTTFQIDHLYSDSDQQTGVCEFRSVRILRKTGKEVRLRYIFVFCFVDGALATLREYVSPLDVQRVTEQLRS